jgi:hypothetical protein
LEAGERSSCWLPLLAPESIANAAFSAMSWRALRGKTDAPESVPKPFSRGSGTIILVRMLDLDMESLEITDTAAAVGGDNVESNRTLPGLLNALSGAAVTERGVHTTETLPSRSATSPSV